MAMAAPAAAETKGPCKKVATDEELEAKLAGPGLKGVINALAPAR